MASARARRDRAAALRSSPSASSASIGDHERVRHARRQLAQLGQDRRREPGRARFASQPRDLEVERPGAAERQREVRPALAGSVGLERQLDPPVREQQDCGQQLGAHVAQGVGIPCGPELLADLVAVRHGEGAEARRAGQPRPQLVGHRIAGTAVEQLEGETIVGAAGRSSGHGPMLGGRTGAAGAPAVAGTMERRRRRPLIRLRRNPEPWVHAFLLSFGVIFLAELGDKSQLMALAFASRYRALTVLVAVTLATLLVHAGSVLVGSLFALALPTVAHPGGRRHRVLRVRGVDAAGRRAGRRRRRPRETIRPLGDRAPSAPPSSSPSSATRRCSRRSPSRRPRNRSGSGSVRRPGWWRRTRSQSRSAPSLAPGCRSARSRCSPPSRSSPLRHDPRGRRPGRRVARGRVATSRAKRPGGGARSSIELVEMGESRTPRPEPFAWDQLRACPMIFVSQSAAHRQASVRPIYVSLDRASLQTT